MNKLHNETNEWYKTYYKLRGADRNDLFTPGVLFQELAYIRAWVKAFRFVSKTSTVLDVGGGDGSGILRLIQAGFSPNNLYMIDLLSQRVSSARNRLPGSVMIQTGDASDMHMYDDNVFNVVTSSTMFIQLLDDSLSMQIAAEMVRVTKKNGLLIIFDWVYDFWKSEYRAVNNKRIKKIFTNSSFGETYIKQKIKGQLIPPIGRTLSKYVPSSYFIIQKLPFVTGLYAYVLGKK